jgi:hypothetical protein
MKEGSKRDISHDLTSDSNVVAVPTRELRA